ncbi:threonine ammonia-lyase, biosynthetic [Brumicola blandensis]|uniref:L-threonine dehydratase n=1 Tax=Brumicola blandensis TaxID=3075611 RepID=A0AAW8R6Y0_9ALTE|nr:threonine ammonia-lyase, biosynthetic [Alteromonas sp. W409]MDT0583733.1 threonine ammonia-lyase, biosynthetic [Alteromonas sp. W409]
MTEVDQNAYQYLTKILSAPVYEAAVNSDLDYMAKLSSELKNRVYLKREDQQPVKSFKIRGAYNCIRQLSDEKKQAGVVAASAGNHAQGVAYAARALKIKATIVMPETTPDIKVDAVKRFGGANVNVVQYGTSFDQASDMAKVLCKEHGYSMIPPFDHPDVIAGQGTIAKEMLEKNPNLEYLFVAVGGGGLAAGVAIYIKQLRPDIKIIGVESVESACLSAALEKGEPVTLPTVGIFADGVAVKTIGSEPFRICQEHLDDVITVSNDEICAAIKDIFDDTRVIAEPAGALSIAAIRKYTKQYKLQGAVIGGILCGANINFHTLRYVSERCELGEQKEAVFAVKIPETKGAFKAFCAMLGGITITEFNYRYAKGEQANIFVGVKLKRGNAELQSLLKKLNKNGYECFDMSDNELAKLHVRHMVGGKPQSQINEHIFSFAFPEYPGALMRFLEGLGEEWNITLFHYRNHGAAEGLVLAGFDIDDNKRSLFDGHVAELGFDVHEHQDNLAYKLFLSGQE